MKIQILNTYLDLSAVAIIGPLENNPPASGYASHKGIGCVLYFNSAALPYWLRLVEGEIDPYQLDESKNGMIRAQAQANYNLLVDRWQMQD